MVTRLAPSPTGALHLGNARTFLVNWLLARKNGWRIVLRIEDLDGPRIKAGADAQAIADLRWLGMDWDEGPIYQSARADLYRAAAQRLLAAGHAYPCICSRKEVELAASAPHAEDGAAVYPGTCRDRFATTEQARAATGREPGIRFRIPVGSVVRWTDALRGPFHCDAYQELGDFVIAKADGTAAYQLAVVVDDAAMGITQVIRGDDLIDSTPRQILLYRALGFGFTGMMEGSGMSAAAGKEIGAYPEVRLADRIPTYHHLPLVIGTDGRRLAKRHGDTRLAFYREQGVRPEKVLALLARWSGVSANDAITLPELLNAFDFDRLPKEPIVFTPDDDRWLRAARPG